MLKYKGHYFVGDGAACNCCTIADKVALDDPTGTKRLRSGFRAILQLRLNRLRIMVRQIIVDNDLLQLNAAGLLPVRSPATFMGGTKVNAFQRWIDQALAIVFLNSDGSDLRSEVLKAYMAGVSFGQGRIGRIIMAGDYQHRVDTIWQLLVVEMQGISEAISQQAVRAVANGLLSAQKSTTIARQVQEVIDRIGTPRSQALINVTVISAFNQGALDVYEAAKVKRVGLIAEAAPGIRKDAATISDAPRRRGPGSRSRSTPGGPGKRTIQRIKSVEKRLEALGRVNIQTAPDACPICEDIADAGPYSINKARSLIPAHPNCRCAFVPIDEGDDE